MQLLLGIVEILKHRWFLLPLRAFIQELDGGMELRFFMGKAGCGSVFYFDNSLNANLFIKIQLSHTPQATSYRSAPTTTLLTRSCIFVFSFSLASFPALYVRRLVFVSPFSTLCRCETLGTWHVPKITWIVRMANERLGVTRTYPCPVLERGRRKRLAKLVPSIIFSWRLNAS